MSNKAIHFVAIIVLFLSGSLGASLPGWPFDVTDLRDRNELVILVFGDSGTGKAGQYRVGHAMYEVCRQRGCDFALMLGDNIYDDGIEVRARSDADASYREILEQFDRKFEAPYRSFSEFTGFHFWAVAGNHDYRRNALGSMLTYSEFSKLWRMPALHYEVPLLPDWIQIYGLHTDTDERRDLNGLQIASAKGALCDESNPNRWKIVFGHQPVYNSGHHRGDANERRTRALVEGPLFRECDVHVYLAGHAHHQEHLTARGFEQVVQGAAGKSKGRNRPPQGPFLRQRHFSRHFGFSVLEVNPDRIRLDFYDVLNTRESGRGFTPPVEGEIVLGHSWCGTREQIGRPEFDAPPCS
ncbi:MAG: metallophosphoesterase [Acidobacteria bacterium]|nr:metallophosphoesterase [Acidobacteriota bacterium]